MSYSTDPVMDAARHWDAVYAAADRQTAAEIAMEQDFILAAKRLDANALARFAPLVRDWHGVRGPQACSAPVQRYRYQTMGEVMTESLDYPNGPDMGEVMQLVLNVAYGDLAATRTQASDLLARMAGDFALHNAQAEDEE